MKESLTKIDFLKGNLSELKETSLSSRTVFAPTLCNSQNASWIKQLLQQDQEKLKRNFSANKLSRDLSHIKDTAKKLSITIPKLPVDITLLKKLTLHSSSSHHSYSRKQSIENLKRKESIDLIHLSLPTGRQDITHLTDWYKFMKEKYLGDLESNIEHARIIYKSCANELVRQVGVECHERGSLLKNLLEDLEDLHVISNKSKTQKLEDLEKNQEKSLKTLEKTKLKIKIFEKNEKELLKVKTRLEEKIEMLEQRELNPERKIQRQKTVKFGEDITNLKSHKEIQTDDHLTHFLKMFPQNSFASIQPDYILKSLNRKNSLKLTTSSIGVQPAALNSEDPYYFIFKDILDHEKALKELFKKIKEKKIKLSEISVENSRKIELLSELQEKLFGNREFQVESTIKRSKSVDFDLFDRYIAGDLDKKSWKAGYEVGFESGHESGIVHANEINSEEEKIQEDIQLAQIEEAPNLVEEEKKEEIEHLGVTPYKRRNTLSQTSRRKKSSFNILSRLLRKNLNEIVKKTSLSKRMVFKQIALAYNNFPLKDKQLIFCDFIYDELNQKYGLKPVSDKKFIEFVSSLYYFRRFKRVQMFLQFLNLGQKLEVPNYSGFSLRLAVSIWRWMLNSSIGIVVAVDEYSDSLKFPVTRCYECLKDHEATRERSLYTKILNRLETLKKPDPKRINPGGLIHFDEMLSEIIKSYEEYEEKVKKNVEIIFEAILLESDDLITKRELENIIRLVCEKEINRFHLDQYDSYEQFNESEIIKKFIELNIQVDLNFDKKQFIDRLELKTEFEENPSEDEFYDKLVEERLELFQTKLLDPKIELLTLTFYSYELSRRKSN